MTFIESDDYEACGHCGFDHEYEPEEARKWHLENRREGYEDHACIHCSSTEGWEDNVDGLSVCKACGML